jgi:cysteine synthase A
MHCSANIDTLCSFNYGWQEMKISNLTDIKSEPLFFQLEGLLKESSLYLKLEGLNIANSIKLKTAITMINSYEQQGILIPGKNKVIESSSGNLGVALSIVCRQKGYSFTCITDPNISPNNERLMKIYECNLIKVTDKDEHGGYLATRIRLIQDMLRSDPTLIWTNQYENLNNVNAHFSLTAQEIFNEFDHVDYLFVGAGTTGTLMGCLKYFNQYSPDTKVIAVDAVGSVTFKAKPAKRYIPGLGTSKSPKISKLEKLQELIYVEEKDTIKMCRYLLKKKGLFVGGSTGSVMHAVKEYENRIKKGSTVVAISPDFGTSYLNTIYNNDWVKEHFGNILQEER